MSADIGLPTINWKIIQYFEEDEEAEPDLEECAELMAEVIARKTKRADHKDWLEFGPGRIIDLEHNGEKIYD